MWLVLGLAFATLAALTVKGHAMSAKMTSGPINIHQAPVTMWTPAVLPLAIKYGIPADFASAWMAVESAGRACAYGDAGAKGPDGNPKELGLFQIYNPDDLKLLNATGNELRAYCVPGTQKQSRDLTIEEIVRHVDLGMQLIKHCLNQAVAELVRNGIGWPADGRDIWRACKLYHALPSIVHNGFTAATKHLGYAPVSWFEFRKAYVATNPSAAKVGSLYWRALENAERTGDFAPQSSVTIKLPNV